MPRSSSPPNRTTLPPDDTADLDAIRVRYMRLPAKGDLWVFGYGSLMWRPGFEHRARESGLLYGYHRSLCMYSYRHRGTRDRPGLVLRLDRGGACRGMAYRIARSRAEDVLDYLWEREMVSYTYLPRTVRVHLRGRTVACRTFIADRDSTQYAAGLSPGAAAAIIRRATGEGGHNRDYLASTVSHLEELGIPDGPLHRLLRIVAETGRHNR
jgi:cation transport protein ChaC